MERYLKRQALVRVAGFTIRVVIKDWKFSYGNERFLVTPVDGAGERWVEKVRLLGATKGVRR